MKDFVKNLIKDIAIDLNDEFDQNFERKAFFDKPWQQTKLHNPKGSLMMRTGALRRSLNYKVSNDSVSWSSSLPYASVHNEGGEITVTAKMKSFFWAMHYKAAGAITETKGGKVSGSKRNQNLSIEAKQWKNLALMKIGAKIKIEQRQFIGNHPKVGQRIQVVFDKHMKEVEAYFNEQFKQK